MTSPTNYSISPAYTKIVRGGKIADGDTGILLLGDSNMCGYGGDQSPTLDATDNQIYQWAKTAPYTDLITAVQTDAIPYLDHAANNPPSGDIPPEVGPDLPFCDRYATERAPGRVVALPCGDAGSGFATGQWFAGQEMRLHAIDLVNSFLANNENNTLGAILIQMGSNDTGYTPAAWKGYIDALINEMRSTDFTPNLTQTSFANVPVVLCGLSEDWYTGVTARQDIHNAIADTPNRLLRTGFASTAGLAGEVGEEIHLSGVSNRTLGKTNAWTAFLAAEANT